MKTYYEQLEELHACSDALDDAHDRTAQECWDTCEIYGWMVWLMRKTLKTKDHQKFIVLICDVYKIYDSIRPDPELRMLLDHIDDMVKEGKIISLETVGERYPDIKNVDQDRINSIRYLLCDSSGLVNQLSYAIAIACGVHDIFDIGKRVEIEKQICDLIRKHIPESPLA